MAFVKYPAGTKLYDGGTYFGTADGTTEYNTSVISTSPSTSLSGASMTTGVPKYAAPGTTSNATPIAPTPAQNYSTTSIPKLGTTAYTNYLLGGEYFAENVPGNPTGQLKPFIPTTSVSNFQMPQVTPYTGSTSSAMGTVSGLQEYYATQAKNLEAERAQAQANQTQSQNWLANFLSSQPSREEIRADAEARAGVNTEEFFASQQAKAKEIETLNNEYAKVLEARDTQLAATQDKMASMNFINNQTAQINRNAAPELNRISAQINSKAAVMEAAQGNYESAMKYVEQAVQDATADKRDKLEAFSMFYEMNQDTLSRLDNQYQSAMDRAYDLAKLQYQEAQDTARLKYTNEVSSVTGGSAANRFTTTQLNKGAVNAALPLADFQKLDPEIQNYFISSSAAYLKTIQDALKQPNAAELINSSNLPQVVKNYLLRFVAVAPTPKTGGLIDTVKSGWNAVTDWLGTQFYNAGIGK